MPDTFQLFSIKVPLSLSLSLSVTHPLAQDQNSVQCRLFIAWLPPLLEFMPSVSVYSNFKGSGTGLTVTLGKAVQRCEWVMPGQFGSDRLLKSGQA